MIRISIFAPPNFTVSRACAPTFTFSLVRRCCSANAQAQRLSRGSHGVAVEEDGEIHRVLTWRQPLGEFNREASIVLPMHLVECAYFAFGIDQKITRHHQQPKGPPHGSS